MGELGVEGRGREGEVPGLALRIFDLVRERLPAKLAKLGSSGLVCEPGVVLKSPSRLSVGRGVVIQRQAILHCGGRVWSNYRGKISLGNHVVIGPGCCLYGAGMINVDDYTHFGPRSMVMTQAGKVGSEARLSTAPEYFFESVEIGKGVWIGAGAVILGGTSLGDNSVVGPNSVVKGKYEPGTTLIGNPARVMMQREKKSSDP
jgi:acetyltransferase-like isoleucine patch superfamily enzyme